MLSGEAGVKWNIGNAMYLYTGAYIDYGLNNIKKDTPKSLLGYDNKAAKFPDGFVYNSMANSLSEKIAPLSIGLKVRFSLDWNFFKKATDKE